YQQSQKPLHGGQPPPEPKTIAAFFEAQVRQGTVSPMVGRHQLATNEAWIQTLNTVPPENRDAAQADIETAVKTHGGAVKLRTATYLWSTSTAPPPRNQAVELDVSAANVAPVPKIFFDSLDADGVDRMASLLQIAVNTLISLTATTANVVSVVTTGPPLPRPGRDGA